jgi:3-methyladenine DNA glycosylase AlkC
MPRKTDTSQLRLWKDYLNRDLLTKLADEFHRTYSDFDRRGFVDAVATDEFFAMELKQRISSAARALGSFLPGDYAKTVDILVALAPKVGGWGNWILTSYVDLYGVDDFDNSMRALENLTPHGTGEFAIRVFMNKYTKRMLPVLNRWAKHPNEHVRRLAAEGSRPRGVWVAHIDAFKEDPSPVLKLLKRLKADRSLYVRKAVANNLNDISKDHPDLVIETALRWQRDGNKHTDWIIKHACRSLIKAGHPEVFPLFGFTSNPKIAVTGFEPDKKRYKISQAMTVPFEIKSKARTKQKLAVDYRLTYRTKTGGNSPKVFKLCEKEIAPGGVLPLKLRHKFEDNSTRKHYTGDHSVELIVNGRVSEKINFALGAR